MINAVTPENARRQLEFGVADDPRWARIIARDRTADGTFWYSVVTTGVYCRPSCPSRTANPKNVQLHDTLADAKATGFRPCQRCNPAGPSIEAGNAALVARACRLIEESEEQPSLDGLAKAVGRSASYFHRSFKAVTGLTPKDYAAAHRASRVREGLASGRSVTEAIYDAGYNSSGRFYEKSTDMLGMTPTRFKAGGANEEIRFALGQTSLGAILIASSRKGVASILLGDDPEALLRQLQDRFPKANLIGADKDYEALVARVVGFIEAPRIGLDLPLDVRGTVFQRRVWQALQHIPVGQTVSYAEIARRIGSPKAVRAVAGACASNNLAVAIPCHRVVRNDGSLSGYAWGVERKKALLDREGAARCASAHCSNTSSWACVPESNGVDVVRGQQTECRRWSPFLLSARPSIGLKTTRTGEIDMSKESDNKAIVGRWFTDFWGKTCNLNIVDEIAAPDMLLQYSLHEPRRGRDDIKAFMTDFRNAFPDLNFWGAADLIAEGDYVVGRWEGGGTHTGPAFRDFLVGSLPANTGRKMKFTGTTVLKLKDGKIVEEVGLDDGVTALTQLGLIKSAA